MPGGAKLNAWELLIWGIIRSLGSQTPTGPPPPLLTSHILLALVITHSHSLELITIITLMCTNASSTMHTRMQLHVVSDYASSSCACIVTLMHTNTLTNAHTSMLTNSHTVCDDICVHSSDEF